MQHSKLQNRVRIMAPIAIILAIAGTIAGAWAEPLAPAEEAARILNVAGVKGGLVAHLGCGGGELTAALRANERYLVHGLDTDAKNVEKARKRLQSLGIYGMVSAARFDGKNLPYADNLVNLLVAENFGGVSSEEVLRVLAPKGVACVRVGGKWKTIVKPWPGEIDEWTHWLHAPDGNAVARDKVVGPPNRLQWTARPLWARHHDTVPSTTAMVSSNGRLFYISDEAPACIDGTLPDKWFLVARDAFNGVLLWKRPISEWGWNQWNEEWKGRFNMPPQLPKRLVAAGDRLYGTLAFNAPLSEMDAATGEVLRVFEGTENTDEILYRDGLLVLSLNQETRKPSKDNMTAVKKKVCVINANTGETFWKKGLYEGLRAKYDTSQPFSRLEMVMGGDRVFLADRDAIVSLDLKTGEEAWRVPRPDYEEQLRMYSIRMSDQSVMVYQDGVILFAQPHMDKPRSWHTLPGMLHAYGAKDGGKLWKHGYGGWAHNWQPDVFVVDGLVWLHDHDDVEFPKHIPLDLDAVDFAVIGLDLKTGEMKRRFSAVKALNERHHHRCYRGKATERFLIPSRRGVEFLNLATEENRRNHWARGGCLHGVVPCNGLLYVPPHPCQCYSATQLNGYFALASRPPSAPSRKIEKTNARNFEKGPAYDNIHPSSFILHPSKDWPTYRHDPLRSGSTEETLADRLKPAWRADLGGRLTPPTVAGGMVFVASVDEHLVMALDADDGKTVWEFTAGGRIDTPPTLYKGLALFGSTDGWVTCLRASDGRLAWRRRVAPSERLVGAYGQIESAWPVPGSILVKDGVAYMAAGRSSYLDEGIHLYALNPETGDAVEKKVIYSPDPETGAMPDPLENTRIIPGALGDILVSDGSSVFLRKEKVFGDGPDDGAHLVATAGLRDDAWFGRTFWTVGSKAQSQILVFNDESAFGFSAYKGTRGFHSADNAYKIFGGRWKKSPPRKPGAAAKERSKNAPGFEATWATVVPLRAAAMVLAGDKLLAAGPPDVVDPRDPLGSYEGRAGGVLRVISTNDGKKTAEYRLDHPPVHDGLAVAAGKLFIADTGGNMVAWITGP